MVDKVKGLAIIAPNVCIAKKIFNIFESVGIKDDTTKHAIKNHVEHSIRPLAICATYSYISKIYVISWAEVEWFRTKGKEDYHLMEYANDIQEKLLEIGWPEVLPKETDS